MPTITLKLELHKPTKAKQSMYEKMTQMNTAFANWLLNHPNLNRATSKIWKDFSTEKFPSAVAGQTIRDVKSKKKNQKAKSFKVHWCTFNNQNIKIEKKGSLYTVSFPTLEKRIGVPVVAREYQQKWLERIVQGDIKLGAATLHKKRKKWYIAVSISFDVEPTSGTKVMGIDLGLRYIAVASVGTKSLFFKGNQYAFVRRRYAALRRRLGKAKKLDAIRKIGNKESRWIKDQNHKISRKIVDFAIANGVGIIRMENLTAIREHRKSRTSDPGRSLHSWPFYQLQHMIAYKAKIAGIRVELVNPKNTSITCKCGHCDKNNRHGIIFRCKKCGYTIHADLNGAINIAKAISGLSA